MLEEVSHVSYADNELVNSCIDNLPSSYVNGFSVEKLGPWNFWEKSLNVVEKSQNFPSKIEWAPCIMWEAHAIDIVLKMSALSQHAVLPEYVNA